MTNRQKRAIWYKERERQIKRQEMYLRENGMLQEFKASKYKCMTWFLKRKGVRI